MGRVWGRGSGCVGGFQGIAEVKGVVKRVMVAMDSRYRLRMTDAWLSLIENEFRIRRKSMTRR